MPKPPEFIKIRNWDKFQHYKRRSPPWIRLYRDVMDSDEWRSLSDAAKALLPELWLMASEGHPGGSLTAELEGIAWKTGRSFDHLDHILKSLQELHNQKFVVLPASMVASTDASASASAAHTDASKTIPQSQRTEGEQSTTNVQNGEPRDLTEKVYIDWDEFLLFAKDFDVHPKHIDMLLDP